MKPSYPALQMLKLGVGMMRIGCCSNAVEGLDHGLDWWTRECFGTSPLNLGARRDDVLPTLAVTIFLEHLIKLLLICSVILFFLLNPQAATRSLGRLQSQSSPFLRDVFLPPCLYFPHL